MCVLVHEERKESEYFNANILIAAKKEVERIRFVFPRITGQVTDSDAFAVGHINKLACMARQILGKVRGEIVF